MKYSEFEKEVEKLGFRIVEDENIVKVLLNDVIVAKINKKVRYKLQTTINFDLMPSDTIKKDIWDCVFQLASTQIDKREKMKKYNVVAYETYEGFKGSGKCTRFYRRNGNNILGAMTEARNSSENQQWAMQQIKDWGLESCERIEAEE